MKKIIYTLILLSFFALIPTITFAIVPDDCDTLRYMPTGDGITIVGYESINSDMVIVPSSINSTPVTAISPFAFEDCSELIGITIPDSVITIGVGAFKNCPNLSSIKLPYNITHLSDELFYGCSALTEISIPSGVQSVGNSAFSDCTSLSTVNIPQSVNTISEYSFYNCTSLTSIELPDGITTISNCLFGGCVALTNITIPTTVTSISNDAFYQCRNLSNMTIPEGVTSIGDCAFYECSSLTNITIPNSTCSLGNFTFYGCTALSEIVIPKSVTSIGNNSFLLCTDLKIKTYSQSTAHTYAILNDISFILLDSFIAQKPTNQNGTIITSDNLSDITEVNININFLDNTPPKFVFFLAIYDNNRLLKLEPAFEPLQANQYLAKIENMPLTASKLKIMCWDDYNLMKDLMMPYVIE